MVHNRYRQTGGEEAHIDLLIEGLREAGTDVHLLQVDSAGIRGVRGELRTLATMTYNPSSYRLVRDEVRRLRADVAHFHNIWPILTPAAVSGAGAGGARTILTIHNYRFACPNGTLLRGTQVHEDCLEGSSLLCGIRSLRHRGPQVAAYGAALSIQRRLGLLAVSVDAFVTPTRFVADRLCRAGYARSLIRVIRYGTREQPVTPVPDDGSRHFLFVGRLSPEKGVDVLVDAAIRAGLPVVIAGAGPLAADLQSRDHPMIEFLGYCDRDRLATLRASSVAAVVPSVCHDVSPFSVIEAAGAGRATIATSLGGLPELVRHEQTGLLVAPRDVSALAAAMTRIWTEPQLAARLGREAAEVARREHGLASSAARHLELYEEVLSR